MKFNALGSLHRTHGSNGGPRTPITSWPHGFLRRIMWGVASVFGLFALLAGAGFTYQMVATHRDRGTYAMPGQLITVDGLHLHIVCIGAGRPTVVLESGLANRAADWDTVQPQVAGTTRVCAYDRAGIGWSDAGQEPRDPVRMAHELHGLLNNAGVPGPYVLVGHSFGGLYTRMYADLYPDEVAGMVLVDASHPDQWAFAPPEFRARAQPSPSMGFAYRVAQHVGVARLMNMFPIPADCGHPAPYCAEEQAFRDSRFMDAYVAEMGAPERDAQVRATRGLGDRPLLVLTASDHSDQGLPPDVLAQFEVDWRQLQADLASLSTNSQHLLVAGSRHGTLQTTHASDTTTAIRRVVDAARTGLRVAVVHALEELP